MKPCEQRSPASHFLLLPTSSPGGRQTASRIRIRMRRHLRCITEAASWWAGKWWRWRWKPPATVGNVCFYASIKPNSIFWLLLQINYSDHEKKNEFEHISFVQLKTTVAGKHSAHDADLVACPNFEKSPAPPSVRYKYNDYTLPGTV